MTIIDGKGRLFGRVNLLDLVVVLAVLAVAGRFGYQKWEGSKVAPTGEDRPVEVDMRFSPVSTPTTEWVRVGDSIYDSKSNAHLGKVVAVRSEPAVVITTGEDGRTLENKSTTHVSFFVTVAGPARVSPNGVTMGGLEMKIGRINYVKTAYWAGYGTTWNLNLEPKPR